MQTNNDNDSKHDFLPLKKKKMTASPAIGAQAKRRRIRRTDQSIHLVEEHKLFNLLFRDHLFTACWLAGNHAIGQ